MQWHEAWEAPNTPTKLTKMIKVLIDFDENYKQISECNHGIVHKRGPKTPMKVTKKGFWQKLQKIMEWNDG